MNVSATLAGSSLRQRFEAARRRTDRIFELIEPEAFWEQPISLRHPIVFYRGHIPAFNVNTLVKKGFGGRGIREDFEMLFERGIDPADETAARRSAVNRWPARAEIEAYVHEAGALEKEIFGRLDAGEEPTKLARAAAHTSIEHELMHQETLLYILHQLPYELKRRPATTAPLPRTIPHSRGRVRIPAGRATLGAAAGEIPFGWDNEFERHEILVSAFEIDVHDVTNGEYLEFVESGGYENSEWWRAENWIWKTGRGLHHPLFWRNRSGRWMWHGFFEETPLPENAPAYVSFAEAQAFSAWRGLRLPTEPEFHRAAFGTPEGAERAYPWGAEAPDSSRGNFDFALWDPVSVGSFPAGMSAWGIHDLLGNGWEWTSSIFAPFPEFRPMAAYPQYSTDFFDGRHFVMKGGSPATDAALLRRSFRNWFQPHYSYPYATFRCAKDAA